jgi:hypothetical protein
VLTPAREKTLKRVAFRDAHTGRANELQAIGDVDQYFAERQHRSLKLLNSTPLFFSG